MKNTIIGTAGHVDHGKTLLIKALTGIDTDRLQEEKKRGITIDLGFAHITAPDGERVGIIDVPGHERFVKNMLAGAGGIDLALLVVAADDGVMPQTKEHLGILSLLDIPDGIIVITKADLVDEEWAEMVADDIRNEVKGTFLENAPIAVVSAYTGQGIDELRSLIFEKIGMEANNLSRPFRIPVDRVFTVEGFGTVITGTLIEGSLSEGEEVEIYPRETRVRVRNLQVHGKDVQTAYAGQRVAVNLAGIKKDEVSRGDTLAVPGSMQNTLMLDVKLRVLKDSQRVLVNGSRLHFYHGARDELCKLVLLGNDALEPGQEGYAQLRFTQPVAAKKGDRFVVRFYSPVETVGGGEVLDPSPQKHKRSDEKVQSALQVRESGSSADNLLQALLDLSPKFAVQGEVQRHLGMDDDTFRTELAALIEQGEAVRLSGKTVIATDYKDTLGRQMAKILRDYHDQNPLQAGMRKDELRGKLLPGRENSLVDKVLALYEEDGVIRMDNQKVALADFEIVYSDADKALSDEIAKTFLDAAYMPPTLDEVMANYPKNAAAAKRVFDALMDTGVLVVVSPAQQMFFHRDIVDAAWGLVTGFVADNGGEITLAQFRDLIGASRKYALPILEYFDRQGMTRKVGDARVLAKP